MGENDNAPFGLNTTKRYVSKTGEEELYKIHKISNHGEIELVDYMGGDETVERVATAGHGKSIFTGNPDLSDFMEYLNSHGIYKPFKFVHLKFNMLTPIKTALTFVYEQTASVNEYSGRYSVMIDSSYVPSLEDITGSIKGDLDDARKRAEIIRNLYIASRERVYANYGKLIDPSLDMTRELARTALGTDNHTRFFWKIDLLSLANFINRGRKFFNSKDQERDYIEEVSEIAFKVAPESWRALTTQTSPNLVLKMPRDEDIVDGNLSPSRFGTNLTRRVTVPALENVLFLRDTFLDHGEFQVTDYMGDDISLAQAARVSYGKGDEKSGTKVLQDDNALVRSLIRDLHTSPIEMAEIAFEDKSPLFIDPRQAGRHRTLDWHSFMGYVPIGSQFYFPPDSEFKHQDRLNRQGRGKLMSDEDRHIASELLRDSLEVDLNAAHEIRKLGADESIIRDRKGVGFYTKISRTGDAHNLGHFLMLRLDKHAQKEIRDLAELVNEANIIHLPVVNEAQRMHVIDGVRLSTREVKFLSDKKALTQGLREEDLNNIEFYKGYGFVIPVDRNDPSKGQQLSREGEAFKSKLKRLLDS